MGSGDFGIVVKDTSQLVLEVGYKTVAEHIVEAHNRHLTPGFQDIGQHLGESDEQIRTS